MDRSKSACAVSQEPCCASRNRDACAASKERDRLFDGDAGFAGGGLWLRPGRFAALTLLRKVSLRRKPRNLLRFAQSRRMRRCALETNSLPRRHGDPHETVDTARRQHGKSFTSP